MQFSLNIIFDLIKSYNYENHVNPDDTVRFNESLPLPEVLTELNRECLYIGLLSKALQLPDDIYCICVRDRFKDAKENKENLKGLVIINENITQNELLEKIIKRIFEIINWNQKMNDILISGGTLQDIVDTCPPVLDNYIAINDASLMLLAYSRSITCDDPICIEFVKNGYHTEEYIKKFRKYNLLKMWETADEVFIDDTCDVAKYVVVHKVFKLKNKYFAHIVMTCNRVSVSPYLLELFQHFVAVVDKYIKRLGEGKNKNIHIYDPLLIDLIENKLKKRNIIDERARYVGLPLVGPYCLFKIESSDASNLYVENMMNKFSELYPRFKFVTYNNSIVAIHPLTKSNLDEQMKIICDSMEEFLPEYDAHCGVGNVYYNLDETPYAYKQSALALKYKDQISASALFRDSVTHKFERLHFFQQKFIYCMIDESERHAELWYHSDYCRKLKVLLNHDRKHKSNYIELLSIFLSQGQNATKVGNILMTHRNNIMYHIGRIKELINVEFDSPSVCFALQTAIVLVELYGFGDEN